VLRNLSPGRGDAQMMRVAQYAFPGVVVRDPYYPAGGSTNRGGRMRVTRRVVLAAVVVLAGGVSSIGATGPARSRCQ
jgi:hypothetical protein